MTVIRGAEPRDVAALEDIENTADAALVEHVNAVDWTPAPTGGSRAAISGFLLVAAQSIDAGPVGFVHVLEVDGIAHLEQLSVRPENGRRGIGRALMKAAMTEALARGYGDITLRTYADVPRNAPFYATCGFLIGEPDSAFQRSLVETEDRLLLQRCGRRVQMTANLSQ